MWIQYINQHTKEKKKFNLSKDKPISRLLEEVPGSGQFCWLVDDEEYKKQQEKIEDKTVKKNTENLQLAGYAILVKEGNFKLWSTFNGEGQEHVKYPPLEPLIFSVGKLPPGTRVELYLPKE
jgi:hypothetical protein